MPLNYYLIYFSVLEPNCTFRELKEQRQKIDEVCSASGTLYSLPPQRSEDTSLNLLKSETT